MQPANHRRAWGTLPSVVFTSGDVDFESVAGVLVRPDIYPDSDVDAEMLKLRC